MNCLCIIVSVYAACSISDKAVMWDALSTIKVLVRMRCSVVAGILMLLGLWRKGKVLEVFPAKRRRLETSMSSLIGMCWWSYLL